MPRRRRVCPAGIPVHLIQRGHNRQACFASDKDMIAYANWLAEGAERFGLDIHAWVLMTNHVHLLLTPAEEGAVSKTMQCLGRLYVRYFNWTYERSGALFEDRFKSSLVQTETYFLACQRYIELNPVAAGMVEDPGDYPWSSYRAHAFGVRPRLWSPHPEYLRLALLDEDRQRKYRVLCQEKADAKIADEIRQSIATGTALGNDRFRDQLEELTGESHRLQRRGRKKRRQLGSE